MKPTFNPRRRSFIQAASASSIALAGGVTTACAATTAGAGDDPWREARAIADKLANPVKFRKADYAVTDFGAAPCELTTVKAWLSFEEQQVMNTPAKGAKAG
jgi:hypothetical protein